jgi:transposase-like protein
LAFAGICEGASPTEAAKIDGVTLQIFRDWVREFNAHGPDEPAAQAADDHGGANSGNRGAGVAASWTGASASTFARDDFQRSRRLPRRMRLARRSRSIEAAAAMAYRARG